MRYDIIEFGTPEYDEEVKLRYDVLRKPLGLEFTEEQLAAEYSDTHLGVYNEMDELIGCLILTPKQDGVVKMRQVAVAANLQGQGVGKYMVKVSESIAKHQGFTRIELNARDTAIPFYEALGYISEGDVFYEVGIEHRFMFKDLE
jgi:predicted GNAT family N-acyltransferase